MLLICWNLVETRYRLKKKRRASEFLSFQLNIVKYCLSGLSWPLFPSLLIIWKTFHSLKLKFNNKWDDFLFVGNNNFQRFIYDTKLLPSRQKHPHSLGTTAIIIFALSKFATIFHDFDDKKRAETPEEKQRKMRFNIAFASPWEKNQKYRG